MNSPEAVEVDLQHNEDLPIDNHAVVPKVHVACPGAVWHKEAVAVAAQHQTRGEDLHKPRQLTLQAVLIIMSCHSM